MILPLSLFFMCDYLGNLTFTDAVKSLPLDLFVFVHQSHRPSSLNLGQRRTDPRAIKPLH